MYKQFVKAFGNLGIRYMPGYVAPLKEELYKANLGILFEVYIGRMLFVSFASLLVTMATVSSISLVDGLPLEVSLISGIIAATTVSLIVLTIYHSYPFQLLTGKKSAIDTNMPFAINHMAAIASAGVPPFVIFKLLSSIKEYGEIAHEAKRVVRNIDVFGMDLTTALQNVADRTPSDNFRQFLYGIISTINTGGDLKRFFGNAARDALTDYRIKREKYLKTLETYADFYTAVLIAAPLFFISILAVMALIGGQVLGMSIPVAMRVGIYVLIPILNTAFIAFIHFTQPKV